MNIDQLKRREAAAHQSFAEAKAVASVSKDKRRLEQARAAWVNAAFDLTLAINEAKRNPKPQR